MKYKKLLLGTALAIASGAASAAQVIMNDATDDGSYYESDPATQTIVFGIGVYQTRSDHAFGYHPSGDAYIDIQEQADRRSVLVLSSYEPTNWNISGMGVGSLDAIYVFGYHDQSVNVADSNIQIYEYSYEGTGNYLGIANSWNDGNIGVFESVIGDDIDAFAGSYQATSFTIPAAVPVPPSLFLFASSLLGLTLAGRTRMKRARQA